MGQIERFRVIVGADYVFVDEESLNNYAHDETENLHFLPDLVIKPRTAEEISAIMVICNEHKIPVTPRGAGTGMSGGALPHLGGVLIVSRLATRRQDGRRSRQAVNLGAHCPKSSTMPRSQSNIFHDNINSEPCLEYENQCDG